MKSKKTPALLLSAILLIGAVVGGTLAWLTDTTDEVTNTFTVGNIGVTLVETDSDDADNDANNNTYKMIPGWTINKDPKANITAGSEFGYLFVKVEKSATVDSYLDYAIHGDWTELEDGVYYIEIDDDAEIGKVYTILAGGTATYNNVAYSWTDDQVLVKPTVDKAMMDAITAGTAVNPKMTFTAYACQLYKTNNVKFTPAEAWAILNPPANP